MLKSEGWFPLVVAAALTVALLAGYRWGARATEDRMLAQDARDAMLVEAFDLAVADRLASMTVRHVTIKQEVQREIIEKAVYRDCVHDSRVLQLINAALTGAVPPGGGELPGTDANDRSVIRSRDDEAD